MVSLSTNLISTHLLIYTITTHLISPKYMIRNVFIPERATSPIIFAYSLVSGQVAVHYEHWDWKNLKCLIQQKWSHSWTVNLTMRPQVMLTLNPRKKDTVGYLKVQGKIDHGQC